MPVRATVTAFGPQLLAKVLNANQTQEYSLALVFRYADDKGLPLLDLDGSARAAHLPDQRRRKPELKAIGGLSSSTAGVLLRTSWGSRTGAATAFFGEPSWPSPT